MCDLIAMCVRASNRHMRTQTVLARRVSCRLGAAPRRGAQVAGGKLAPLDVQLGLLQRCFTALVIDEADEILYAATASGDVVTVTGAPATRAPSARFGRQYAAWQSKQTHAARRRRVRRARRLSGPGRGAGGASQVSLPRRMLRRTGPLPPGKPGKGAAPGPGGPLAKATALALVPGGGPLLVGGAEGPVLVLPRDCPSVDVRAGARYRKRPRQQGRTSPAGMPQRPMLRLVAHMGVAQHVGHSLRQHDPTPPGAPSCIRQRLLAHEDMPASLAACMRPSGSVSGRGRLQILAEVRLPGGVTSLALRPSVGGAGVAVLAGTADGDVFLLDYDGSGVRT